MCDVISASTPPLVIAHRGASGYRPEHTRAAFELAIEMGADAIEPDIVATRDGVLVVRHENEISGTTDVSFLGHFADRKTTKVIDGVSVTGWFTEDFTWAELSTLRSAERLPAIRRGSATFIGGGGILRLADLLQILDDAPRPVVLVAEIKHPTYFNSIGLSLTDLFAEEIRAWATGDNLIVECFEKSALITLKAAGIPAKYIYLIDDDGAPADAVAALGDSAPTYQDALTDQSLTALAAEVDGLSLSKWLVLDLDADGNTIGTTDVVDRIHAAGLTVFLWTLRAENHFLSPNFRTSTAKAGYGRWADEFRMLLGTGVDGVFADQPDLALRVRDELSGEASALSL